ncbi:MAG: hypothetical protein K2P54_09480 [Odoribacter sp.]|nr:hypothetical protein [Odoribacter sp.]
MKCSIYTVGGKDFSSLVGELLEKCGGDEKIVRLVFWGSPRELALIQL